jgi:hypothetical protein
VHRDGNFRNRSASFEQLACLQLPPARGARPAGAVAEQLVSTCCSGCQLKPAATLFTGPIALVTIYCLSELIEQAVWERVRTMARLESSAEQTGCAGESVRQLVERITYDRGQQLVRLAVRAEFGGEEIELPLVRLGHKAKRGRLPRITRLMALAVRGEELLRTGVVQNYAELARLGIVSRPRMTQVMNLLNLAPEIQEEVLFWPEVEAGPEPVSERALRRLPGVMSWDDQLEIWNQLRERRPSSAV